MTRLARTPVPVAAALCLAAACASAARPPAPVPAEAPYVFEGRVVAANSSTLRALPAGPATYRVAVDAVHYQEGTFEDLRGREITLVSADSALLPGSRYVFYAEPFAFGESVAARLVRAMDDTRPGDTLAAEQRRARERRTLGERVREAEVVVVGTVASVAPAEVEPRPRSEHDPELWRAALRVERVLKGSAASEVSFVFAASRDVMWYRAPKPAPGDAGVFLLNAGAPDTAALGIGARQLTLFHPLDLQPREKAATLRDLLQPLR